jgi:hypothetical protein
MDHILLSSGIAKYTHHSTGKKEEVVLNYEGQSFPVSPWNKTGTIRAGKQVF